MNKNCISSMFSYHL